MICRAGPAARADREDAAKELSLDEHRHMQVALMLRPEQGAVIRGSGDLRKIRCRRGGLQVLRKNPERVDLRVRRRLPKDDNLPPEEGWCRDRWRRAGSGSLSVSVSISPATGSAPVAKATTCLDADTPSGLETQAPTPSNPQEPRSRRV